MKTKWYYYAFKQTGYVWKQKDSLKENPSSKYDLLILDKKEAQAIAKQNGIKINNNNHLKTLKMGKKDKKSEKAKGKDKKQKEKNPKNDSKDEKKKSPQQAGGQRKFAGSIALTKLQHVILEKKNKKGKKIECIVIPIDSNYIERGKDKDGKLNGALYMNVSVITKTEEDEYKQHGFIGQNVSSTMWKEAKPKEQEKMGKLPILGNLKDFSFNSDNYTADTGGSAGEPIDEDDDLPF
jgi:hypothetical protein